MPHTRHCTVCGSEFQPELKYQIEERLENGPDGRPTTVFAYYCSVECLNRSHLGSEQVTCDVCEHTFSVELVSQVINHGGRRFHACSPNCRRSLLERLHGPRTRSLGELLARPIEESRAPASRSVVIRGSSQPLNLIDDETPQNIDVQEQEERVSNIAPIPIENAVKASPDTPASGTLQTSVLWKRIQSAQGGAPRVLAVFNHKGGTGKTTTSVTLAAGLAARGRRVLLVDTDGQGNIAVSFGIESTKSLYHVLVMGLEPQEAVVNVRPGLDVLPSNETLAAAELHLAGRKQRDRVLVHQLGALAETYDHVVVDCSPSLSLLNQNALVFADSVLCPVACDYLSLVGVRQVLRTLKQVHRLLNHPVRLWGVLPTLYDARARVCIEALETLKQHFGDRCLDPIRMASRVKEAPSLAKTLVEHAPDATATQDYLKVVDRFLAEEQIAEPLKAAAGDLP